VAEGGCPNYRSPLNVGIYQYRFIKLIRRGGGGGGGRGGRVEWGGGGRKGEKKREKTYSLRKPAADGAALQLNKMSDTTKRRATLAGMGVCRIDSASHRHSTIWLLGQEGGPNERCLDGAMLSVDEWINGRRS